MYNKVFLIGNLARDPELRFTTSGIPVARFAIAVNRILRREESAGGNDVDFINILAWRRLAEICGEYLKKGMSIAVEGRLEIRSYKGKDGEMRTMTEVTIDNMQMLGKKTSTEERIPLPEIHSQQAEVNEGLASDAEAAGEAPF